MKWGVRKARTDESVRSERRQASKNRRVLKDGDIDAYISRLEKEKKLKNLVNEDVNAGRTYTKNALADIGKRTVATAGAGLALYAVRAAIQKQFSLKEAADYLKPKKK
jgi:hypothetical protein